MKQSRMLAQEEAEVSAAKMPVLGIDVDKFIKAKDGFYDIELIQCTGDYVAIAPLHRSEVTEGGIVVPGQAGVNPDDGLIVGLGDNVGKLSLGQHVKFIPRHKAADLTGAFPFYGNAEISVYKVASVVAILPPVEARQVNA